ncbi:hypothetical protein AMS68_004002 [Peltaster fructicola]|uniref:NAD-dependent epimerase/dehydratase domain-containing protein n=1 Tax=Peltaster fructicola TaxID=286661 RepID=A0A6H0XV03_9PEZI|nr:hypothetical protein AMS68_004002 [Peltaster fructicola]
MKIVLAGTGFIGQEILDQCIQHQYIHHIYVLTRKPLDIKYRTHKKITQVQHENFDELPDILFGRFNEWGVSGCIWAVGPRSTVKNADEIQKIGVTYPVNAAEQFAKMVAPDMMESQTGKNIKPFRFVFISGWGAEHNQFRQLWVWSEWRKMKGSAEKGLNDVAAASQEIDGKKCLEVISLRAGTALAGGQAVTSIVSMATTPSIAVDLLAKTAIRVVLDGDAEGRTVLENKDCMGDEWAQINTLTLS